MKGATKALIVLLLIALVRPVRGAMHYDGTADATAIAASAEVTAVPLTICQWAKPVGIAASIVGGGLYDNTAALDLFQLSWDADAKIHAYVGSGGSYPSGISTGTYSAATWQHACARFMSATSRDAALTGTIGSANTTNLTPTGINATAVGTSAQLVPGQQFDGAIAEVGIWHVALSDAEVLMLAAGFAPPCVRRSALVSYFPMVTKVGSTLPDISGSSSISLTLGSGTATATHPRIHYCQ